MTAAIVTALRRWRLDGTRLHLTLAELPAARSLTGGWPTAGADGVETALPDLPPAPPGAEHARELVVAGGAVLRQRRRPRDCT